jgi:c-di-GMP-binding flagellar brake protein YcgR
MTQNAERNPLSFNWTPGSPPLILDTPDRIGALLAHLRHERVPLPLRIGHSLDTRESRILTFDMRHRLMYIAAPQNCFEGLLHHGVPLRLWGTDAGSHVEFVSTFHSQVLLDGGLAACIMRPTQIECREHRTEPRTQIASGQLAQLQFNDGALSHRGRLVDLSSQGAGAVVDRDCPAQVGGQLSCDLELPTTRIQAEAEVRSRVAQASGERLGLLFASLSRSQEAQLGAAIDQLSRNR